MSKTTYSATNGSRNPRLIFLFAVVIVILGWLAWQNVYQDSTRVFWSMIGNNLATTSVVKHDSQSQGGQSTDQYTQIQFGAANSSHSIAVVSQLGSTITTETIGTTNNDYSRYLNIKTSQKNSAGKAIDTSKVTGVWAKTANVPAGQLGGAQYFRQNILGVVPFGNFTVAQRQRLLDLMKNNQAYELAGVTSAKLGGRAVYVYKVNIHPQGLVTMLQQYAKDLGLGDIGLDPSQFAGSAVVKTEFSVDKLSHQLVKLHFSDANQDETYSSQGLEESVALPGKTVPVAQLQSRLQQSLQ